MTAPLTPSAEAKSDNDAIKQALLAWFDPRHRFQGDFEARMRKAVEAYREVAMAQDDWPEVVGAVQGKDGTLISATIKCGDQEFRVAPADAQAHVTIPKGCVSVEALCDRLNQYPIPTRIGVTTVMKLIQEVADAAPALPAVQDKEA